MSKDLNTEDLIRMCGSFYELNQPLSALHVLLKRFSEQVEVAGTEADVLKVLSLFFFLFFLSSKRLVNPLASSQHRLADPPPTSPPSSRRRFCNGLSSYTLATSSGPS